MIALDPGDCASPSYRYGSFFFAKYQKYSSRYKDLAYNKSSESMD